MNSAIQKGFHVCQEHHSVFTQRAGHNRAGKAHLLIECDVEIPLGINIHHQQVGHLVIGTGQGYDHFCDEPLLIMLPVISQLHNLNASAKICAVAVDLGIANQRLIIEKPIHVILK